MLSSLAKAVVGVVTTPVSMAADVVTIGCTTTSRKESYTCEHLSDILENLSNATKPE